MPLSLILKCPSFPNGGPIPEAFAFCKPDGAGKSQPAGNRSPAFSWTLLGETTPVRSLALIAVDPDVPASFDDANKEGRWIAETFPRQDFYHWAWVDLPPDLTHLPEGVGKGGDQAPWGVLGGNDYGPRSIGYDGPCPPWNDTRLHHYHFTLYALSVPTLGLSRGFPPRDALSALTPHILGSGTWMGTYSTHAGSTI